MLSTAGGDWAEFSGSSRPNDRRLDRGMRAKLNTHEDARTHREDLRSL